MGLFWVPGHAGVRGIEIADELARGCSVLKFVGPEPALGVSRQDTRRRFRRWLRNQQWAWWRGLGDTQSQARELISGPCLGVKARLLSFNKIKSRAVSGFLTGYNTLRRRFRLLELSDSPLCRGCGAEDETSALTLNIPSLARQRCLSSWGLRRIFFFVISQLFDAVDYSNYVSWVSETIVQ